jgi:hypothetical protein
MKNNEGIEVGTTFDRFDAFGSRLPQFNIEGTEKVGSLIGFILTILMSSLIFGFSLTRIKLFIVADRPDISSFVT